METETSTMKRLLQRIRVPQHLSGFRYLCVVVPKYQAGRKLCGDDGVYGLIGKAEKTTWRNIERRVHFAIRQSDKQGTRPLVVIAELREQFEREREAFLNE